MFSLAVRHTRQDMSQQHYGLQAATLQSGGVAARPQKRIINDIPGVPRGSHFVEGSKGW
jgi:hypothetical protein